MSYNPKIRTIQLVLRAHLDDGYVYEGTTRAFPNSIVEEEDSIFFVHIDCAVAALDNKEIRDLDDLYLNVLVERLRTLPLSQFDQKSGSVKDLIDLCKRRLALNIKAKNFTSNAYFLKKEEPEIPIIVVEEPMKKKDIHVVPNKEGGWDVQEAGNKTPLDHKPTKKEAVAAGRELAKVAQVELVIHNKDGKISDKDSYGNDPRNIKDKKH